MSDAPKVPVSWRNHVVTAWATCVALILERREEDTWTEVHRIEIGDPRGGEDQALVAAESLWQRALAVADEEGGVLEFRIGAVPSKGSTRWCARSGRLDVGGATPRVIHGDVDHGAGLLKAHAAATEKWASALERRDTANEKIANVVVQMSEKLGIVIDRVADVMLRSSSAEAEAIKARLEVDRETIRANAFVSQVQLENQVRLHRMDKATKFAENFGPALIPAALAWLDSEIKRTQSNVAHNEARTWRLLSVAVRAAGQVKLADAIATGERNAATAELARAALEWTQPIHADPQSPDLLQDVQRWARWVLAGAK